MSVPSPCISICVLNEHDVCEGCYRTADEITRWGSSTKEEQEAILDCVKVRRSDAQTVVFK